MKNMKKILLIGVCILLVLAAVVTGVLLGQYLRAPALLKLYDVRGLTAENIERIEFHAVYDRGIGWESDDPAVIAAVYDMLCGVRLTGGRVGYDGSSMKVVLHFKQPIHEKTSVSICFIGDSVTGPAEEDPNQNPGDHQITDYYSRAEWESLLARCELVYDGAAD